MFLPSRHKLSGIFVYRGTKLLECCEVVMVFQNCLGCKAQCRGRSCLEGRNLSWLQEIYCRQCAEPGVQLSFLSCLGSRNLFAKTVTSNLPLLSVLGVRSVIQSLPVSSKCLKKKKVRNA